jgi:hypothetical protein
MKKEKIDFWSMFTSLEQLLLIALTIVILGVLYSIIGVVIK